MATELTHDTGLNKCSGRGSASDVKKLHLSSQKPPLQPPVALLARLDVFLPQMARANENLAEQGADTSVCVELVDKLLPDNIDENDSSGEDDDASNDSVHEDHHHHHQQQQHSVVEMNLTLVPATFSDDDNENDNEEDFDKTQSRHRQLSTKPSTKVVEM